MKNQFYFLSTVILSLAIFVSSCGREQMSQNIQNEIKNTEFCHMLEEWGKLFCAKIDSNYSATVNFSLTDASNKYHIVFQDKNFTLNENTADRANFAFRSSINHYNKIYNGEITGFTSVGRENISDTTPLDIEMYSAVTDHLMNDVLFFVQRFFNASPHDKVILKKEHARIVHGSYAIPLFYQRSESIGVRSAWYQIEKGQQVNETGDTNPFPQYFIITKGQGYAKIGNDTLKVKSNESYYIAPGLEHIFWNELEEPIELIFLAWGKGA